MRKLKLLLIPGLAVLAFLLALPVAWAGTLSDGGQISLNRAGRSGLAQIEINATGNFTHVILSNAGSGSPDIDINSTGEIVAVVYYKMSSPTGGEVFIKSATASGGWLISRSVGYGSLPRLAFDPTLTNTVYVVWANTGRTALKSARCTLSAPTMPVCPAGKDLGPGGANVAHPAIVVDNLRLAHVVWEDNGTIKSAHSTDANLTNWTTPVSIPGGGNDHKPALARSNGRLHLAFVRGDTSVQYRYSDDGLNWVSTQKFALKVGGIGEIIEGVYDKLDNPTIAASGNNVFLAWDAHQLPAANNNFSPNSFSLMGISSSNKGDGGWLDTVKYLPSGIQAQTLSPQDEVKLSTDTGSPAQKEGLQPSLTISNTGPSAVVWQESRDSPGCNSDISCIYLASPMNAAPDEYLLNDGLNDYMISPDLAIAGSALHFVYMVDLNTVSTGGGGPANYFVGYYGPFTKVNTGSGPVDPIPIPPDDPIDPVDPNNPNDPGNPSLPPGGPSEESQGIVYLPVILK